MPSRSVILDTNFLLIPYQFKINIIKELDYLIDIPHSLVVSKGILRELNTIAKSQGKRGVAARVGLKMVEFNKDRIEIVDDDSNVDDWVLDYATKNNSIVCTNDVILRKRLKPHNIKVVVLKSKSKLGFA